MARGVGERALEARRRREGDDDARGVADGDVGGGRERAPPRRRRRRGPGRRRGVGPRLVGAHAGEERGGARVALKVRAHGRQERVDGVREAVLEVRLRQGAPDEGVAHGVGARDRRAAGRERRAGRREDHVPHVVEARVLQVVRRELHLRVARDGRVGRARAVRAADLPPDVGRRVLHEDGRVGVRLGHLRLAGLEAVEHVVRQDDGLALLAARRVAVVAREHVDLSTKNSCGDKRLPRGTPDDGPCAGRHRAGRRRPAGRRRRCTA